MSLYDNILGGYSVLDERMGSIICDTNFSEKIQICKQGENNIEDEKKLSNNGYHLIMHNGKFTYIPVIKMENSTYYKQKYINPNIYNFKFDGINLEVLKK